ARAQPRGRRSHAGQPGPDLHRARARPQGRDVQPQPAHRAPASEGAGQLMRRKRRSRGGISAFKAGAIGIVLIAAFSYAVYTKFANPFARPYTIHATFASANGLQSGSLVRIAGVDVGKVTDVSLDPGCHSAYQNPDACRAA